MGIYGICKPEQRTKILMLGSCFFTAWKDPLGLINLFAAVLLAYIGGILIYNFRTDVKKSRILLGLCCAVNAAMLILFPTADSAEQDFSVCYPKLTGGSDYMRRLELQFIRFTAFPTVLIFTGG